MTMTLNFHNVAVCSAISFEIQHELYTFGNEFSYGLIKLESKENPKRKIEYRNLILRIVFKFRNQNSMVTKQ